LTLSLVFPLEPRSKANAMRSGRGGFYHPAWVRKFEQAVKLMAIAQCQAAGLRRFPVFDGKVEIVYRFYFKRDPTNRDLDNARKSVNDALQGVLYKNDAQIWRDKGEKLHDPERPRIEIEVEEL
jgi:Holliday junction resolvase RusA-like endonuclease